MMHEGANHPHQSYQYQQLPPSEQHQQSTEYQPQPPHQQHHGSDGGGGVSTANAPTKAEYIIGQLNVTNAKKVALLVVLGFICYHGLIHLRYGTDSCKWLLSDGRFKGDREWQPYGCMMHKYTQADTRRCFCYLAFLGTENHIVFIGDERMRLVYDAFVRHQQTPDDQVGRAGGNAIDTPPNDDDTNASAPAAGLTTADSHTDAEYVNSQQHLRVQYIYANEVADPLVGHFERWQRSTDPPSAIVVGCTHSGFFRGNLSDDTLQRFRSNLTRLMMPIDALVATHRTKVLWKMQDDVDEEAATLPDAWRAVQNADIARYNDAVLDVLGYSDIQMWTSARRVAAGLVGENVAGWRLSELALRHDTQILLNMYCNDNMNYNDGSCCSSAEPYTWLQIVTYAVFGVFVVLATGMALRRWWMRLRGHTFYMPLHQEMTDEATMVDGATAAAAAKAGSAPPVDYRQPIGAMATLAVIMTYFYLCDRTNFFMKENKYYSEFSFWIPVGYVFVLGLFFTEDSKYTKVLHRDQTDELKGWMQLVILIYHMTGADRVLPIYMHIKVLISGYLFLSGYGHFTYMWHTGNAGVTRMLQILFRLNFTTIVLCLCMNRPYQFYYYVPLISYWFVLMWFVLAVPPQVTAHSTAENGAQLLYLVAKVVCLFGVATVLYMSEVFFERVFVTRPWKALFVTTDDDIHEWWYRWKLDRYTITAGMVFAACFHVAQRHNLFDDNNHGNLFNRRLSIVATLAAIAGVGFYTTFTFMCSSKLDCDEIHSYIVFIPIVGYLVLRNISGILRTRFSAFFAWFGRISLELFVCQYHVWLAADRNGVLVLLPGFPNANIIVTSFVFVCVAHEVHRVTHVLLPWAVPNDWRLALRNLAVFVVVLIPIGRYDGMI